MNKQYNEANVLSTSRVHKSLYGLDHSSGTGYYAYVLLMILF